MSKNTIKFLVNTGIGFVVAFLVMWSQGVFAAETTPDVLRVICDGFFIAGAVLFLGGGLVWADNGGVFDGLTYTFKQAVARVKRDFEQEKISFAEHREKREAKASSPLGMVLAGLVHLAIAAILFVVYLKAAG